MVYVDWMMLRLLVMCMSVQDAYQNRIIMVMHIGKHQYEICKYNW